MPPLPFLGRRSEIAELEAGLADAVAGHGALVLVAGEAGIGKTRLVDELSRRAPRVGAASSWGLSWESGGAPPFWPWIQILRDLSRSERAAEQAPGPASYLSLLVPELTRRGEAATPPTDLASQHARFRLFDEATTFLRNAAATRPLLLILEDLHAADLPSLLLLRFLARSLRDARILAVGTTREVEARRRPDIAATLDDIAREGRRLVLGGLDEDEVAALVKLVCGVVPSRELVSSIYRATEGNPFFTDETLRLLLSENRGRLPAGGAPTLPVPTRVREAIRRRLETLPEHCRGTLTVAAVLGKEFDGVLVARVTGLDAEDLRDWVTEVESLGLVRASPKGHSFTHALIRETVYDDLTGDERAELHARVAEVLEASLAGDSGAPLAEIAFHYHAGFPRADEEKAIDFAISAARRAIALCAY
ncbi:MAG: ATP-binding protein, partial [Candidatus Binatia bacterium]